MTGDVLGRIVILMNTTNIPDAAESARLDDATAYASTILNHLHGDDLEQVLTYCGTRRYARTDAAYRQHALDNTHPDDLIAALVSRGYTLARFGISSTSVEVL